MKIRNHIRQLEALRQEILTTEIVNATTAEPRRIPATGGIIQPGGSSTRRRPCKTSTPAQGLRTARVRRGRPKEDGCGRAATDGVRTTPTNPQPTRRAPISCRSSLTCGNKSEPVTDVLDVIVNDDGPELRALDSEASRQMNGLLSTPPEKHREMG